MFDITYEDAHGHRQYAWQNSWGLTTRTIGVMIMVHSDDYGLVLPPRVAPTQVVIIPIIFNDATVVLDYARSIADQLKAVGIRVEVDDRTDRTPGFKFNHWEVLGVPLRIDVGPKDIQAQQVVMHRRDLRDASKAIKVPLANVVQGVQDTLTTIQNDLFNKAKDEVKERRTQVNTWADFLAALDKRNTVLAPHCDDRACEKAIKEKSGEAAKEEKDDDVGDSADADAQAEKLTGAAKSLCIPFEQPQLAKGTKCVHCDKEAKHYTIFGRSY